MTTMLPPPSPPSQYRPPPPPPPPSPPPPQYMALSVDGADAENSSITYAKMVYSTTRDSLSPPNPSPTPSYSSDHGAVHSLHQNLQKVHSKLKGRIKILVVMLLLLLTTHTLSLNTLNEQYPAVWKQFVARLVTGTPLTDPRCVSGGVGGAAELGRSCASMSEHLKELEARAQSSVSAGGPGCTMDVETALCLLTKTKTDLDARTKRLDTQVYRNSKQLENLFPGQEGSKDHIVVYSRRPSVHLSLFYSHEYRPPTEDRFKSLLWTHWQSGLSSMRDMDVTVVRGNIVNIRVKRKGYYHVYSQVTFGSEMSGPALDGAASMPLHRVVKNYRTRTERLLLASCRAWSERGVSYLQGIFKFKASDTLTVLAPIHLVDTTLRQLTFFGAYQI